MKVLFAIACAGCGFSPALATDAAISGDGAPTFDALDDALPHCEVGAVDAVSNASGVLGNAIGAGTQPDLVCAAGEVVIGYQFEVTVANPPQWNEKVVMATHQRCGKIGLAPDGQMHTTAAESAASVANQCNTWPASNNSMEMDCPDGDVLVGISGNEAMNGGQRSLFDSVILACAPLDFHGAPTQPIVYEKMTDTGTATNNSQSVQCGTGAIAVATGVYTLCGQDALRLQCAKSGCM